MRESPVKPREQQRRSPRLANSPNGNAKKRSPNELTPQIVSPSKFRHKLFTEEAPKLAPGEELKPCPRCTGPSRIVPSENKGLCSRIGCQFNFCTLCNCLYHLKETPCRLVRGCKIKPISPPNNSIISPNLFGLNNSITNSKARVSSKQSKRRLKRLWRQNIPKKSFIYDLGGVHKGYKIWKRPSILSSLSSQCQKQ